MRARYKACILSLFLPLGALGQPYRAVVGENIWTGSQNAAGWRAPDYHLDALRPHIKAEDPEKDRIARYAQAELYGTFEDGGFKPPHGGRDVWTAGVRAASLMDLPRTTLFGNVRFEQRNAREVMGSLFLQPDYYPVDVLEFTPGPKTRQTYSVSGGLAREMSENWVFGVRGDFESANYAKRKDIRHTNYALDLSVSPGILYHWHIQQDLDLDLGLSYRFRKTSESVDAEQVGAATADSYYAFFNKGMNYGTYQVWDGAGIHLDEAGVGLLPVTEITHGGAFQACLQSMILLEAGYDYSEGLVGEKGYDWFRFPGHGTHLDLTFRILPGIASDTYMLFLRTHLESRTQTLNEAVWDKETSGGVTTPSVYGYNRVFRRKNGEERYSAGLTGSRWLRQLQLEYGYRPGREYSTLTYPYTDTLSTRIRHVELSGRICPVFDGWRSSRWEFSFRLRGQWGRSDEQGLVATDPSAVPESMPFRLTEDWVRKQEALLAPRIVAGLSLRRSFSRGLYLDVSGSYTRGFHLQYLEPDRWRAGLTLGYNFTQHRSI